MALLRNITRAAATLATKAKCKADLLKEFGKLAGDAVARGWHGVALCCAEGL